MTRRDWAHLAGLLALLAAIYLGTKPTRDALLVAADARGRAMRLESELAHAKEKGAELRNDLARLEDRIRELEKGPNPGEWRTFKWYVDELRAIHELERRNEQAPTEGRMAAEGNRD